jgi:hypothetical protein
VKRYQIAWGQGVLPGSSATNKQTKLLIAEARNIALLPLQAFKTRLD